MVCLNLFVIVLLVVSLTEANRYIAKNSCNKCAKKGPPYCIRWCTYIFVNARCVQSRYVCCSYREKPGFCPATTLLCIRRHPYRNTKMFRCRNDFNCPMGYKCCEDSCIFHKVCKPIWNWPVYNPTATTTTPTTTTLTTTTPTTTTPTTTTPTTTTPTTTTSTTTTPTSTTPTTTTPTTTTPTTTILTTTTPTTTTPTTTTPTTTTPTTTTTTTTTRTSTTPTTTTTTPSTTTTSAKPTVRFTTIKPTINENTISFEDITTVKYIEGSGIGEIVEPNAELVNGFFDDEDFYH